MKAFAIEGVVQNEMIGDIYDLAVVNFSNADMVGHLAPRHPKEAAAALEYVDDAVGQLVAAAGQLGWSILVTADHGNIEDPGSSHTSNDVFTSLVSPVGSTGNAMAVSLIGGRSPPEPLVTTK